MIDKKKSMYGREIIAQRHKEHHNFLFCLGRGRSPGIIIETFDSAFPRFLGLAIAAIDLFQPQVNKLN